MCQKIATMSTTTTTTTAEGEQLQLQGAEVNVNEKLNSLKEKVVRTTKFLKELKTLSKNCQELTAEARHDDDTDDDAHKERQIFIRRIVQLGAEIEDSRDVVLSLCKQFLPLRQWKLIAEDFQADSNDAGNDNDDDDDDGRRFGGVLNGFDIDPSVRFFGIDWESVFGRCFSLSLNVKIFGEQITDVMTASQKERHFDDFDLVLINRILRDLATLEADVTAHAEAVLQGRLSKSQRKLIQKEQLKYSSTPFSTSTSQHRLSSKPSMTSKVSKSKSFRDAGNKNGNASVKSRQAVRYKKNKTTNLDKLSSSAMTPTSPDSVESRYAVGRNSFDDDNNSSSGDEQRRLLEATSALMVTSSTNGNVVTTAVTSSAATTTTKKKTSFIQNVSSILKNIR